MSVWLQCIVCGQDCIESDENGMFSVDDDAACPDCGTINYITVDDDLSENPTADISSNEDVKDIGQNKCNGECGSVESWHGNPCRWDCKRSGLETKA